ncbi:hypothetical protein MAR_024360 [Mya arenaria]|uniref:Uncharacterized protein n=1 Tax=Mya arenaria TaxID=6604 RepID=A0ABY7DQK8_MYAAR|nr:hypothetical protein MAR_024360 [Mya arenaria]
MMIFFSSFLLSVCEFYSVDSAMYMPNAVKGRFSFRNCNNTPVPLIFDHVDIQPDPVQMDLGYASLSVRLKTSNGETELCYIIGGQCYVSDLCYFIKTTLNIPTCTIEPPNAVKGGLSFRNCNSTPVPLTFEHVDIQPDPVQMDLGYINLSMNATLTKMIGNSSKVDFQVIAVYFEQT